MADIRLTKVSKRYGSALVIEDLSLDIRSREFVVFLGPSGCGKSTLLRMIAGLEDISGGEISIAGEVVNEVPARHRGVSMVFQNYALYPHMSVYENISFGLRNTGVPKDEIKRRVTDAARILRIEELLDRKPRDMSGGQRQRVAIGRAIVRQPRAFLFDEPLSNLDAELRVQMRAEIARLHHSLDATMIFVTHDQVEAMTMADRIVVMRSGRIEQVGTPIELYREPRNLFVAGFLGSPKMNFLEGKVSATGAGRLTLDIGASRPIDLAIDSHPGEIGAASTLGLRPEHLQLTGPEDGALRGKVELVEKLGNTTHLHVALTDGRLLIVEDSGESQARVDDLVGLDFQPDRAHLFDATGNALPRLAS
jgi:ABC-type sugar transport system ATPase subunit